MAKQKATIAALEELHGLLAGYFKLLLEDANASGEELPSGTINAVINFLKQNDISADSVTEDELYDITASVRGLIQEYEEEQSNA
jgi:hypothetical protein